MRTPLLKDDCIFRPMKAPNLYDTKDQSILTYQHRVLDQPGTWGHTQAQCGLEGCAAALRPGDICQGNRAAETY